MQKAIRSLLLLALCALMGAAEHADEPVQEYHLAPYAYATVAGPPGGDDDKIVYHLGTEELRTYMPHSLIS